MSDIKICFVSPKIYPLLKNSDTEFIGGAELQQALIGKYIHEKGYEVCYVSYIYSNEASDELIDGIKVYKTCVEKEGIPVIKFIHPMLTTLWRALKKADCDIYYQRGAAAITGIVACFCRLHGKKFIFSGANDSNFTPEVKGIKYTRDKLLYKWGLKNSHHILVQSETQRRMLERNFGRKGTVSYNVYPARNLTHDRKYVLWVANIKPSKQPGLLLSLARRSPELRFVMVGGRVASCPNLYDEIRKKASELANVEFLGFQPFDKTEQFFDGASVFVNTSELHREGFPNTFLQAWSRGIPTVSFFDIDDIIRYNRLGAVVSDADEAKSPIEEFMFCDGEFRSNIQKYFESHHLTGCYLRTLDEILERPMGGQSDMLYLQKGKFDNPDPTKQAGQFPREGD